ncbi:MAG: hypothetical protein EA365_14885 [Gloeocapsa sp. DLM2.Bin57]|nr:MAG: hypothetical protein EA365_14885 [Gloeocapsa sp. DLM2.Bin57]
MDISSALPTFVVTLREGFEASLIVGIILACLAKAGQTQLNRWVYQGIGAGIVASVMLGLFLWEILNGIDSVVIKQLLQGGFGVVAIALLSWMLIWMTQQAKSLKSEVESKITQALTEEKNAQRLVFLLVFVAVLQEGFETVLFIVAKFEQEWLLPGLGAIAGLGVAVILGFLLFKWGVRLNIRLFFQIMGVFLLLIIGGLVVGTLRHFETALLVLSQSSSRNLCLNWGQSCLLGPLVWDWSGILPDKQFPGILLKSLLGYRERLYLVQAIAYLTFLGTIGSLYVRSLIPQTANLKSS